MTTLSLPVPIRGAAAPPSGHEPGPGSCFGNYEILAPVAAGGTAYVWIARAMDTLDAPLVALKTLRPECAAMEGMRRMFLDEARLASRIAHPNVVEVLDRGQEGRAVWQVMPLVEGCALSELVAHARAPLPVGVALRIAIDMLRGLHAAHELTDADGRSLEVVHRDVSPHNVLVGVDGNARVADFGVAKSFGRTCDETAIGQIKGKIAYMSPEQLAHRGDRRSDVFAVGIVLWEMLTGARLFRSDDVLQAIDLVREMEIPDPREHAAHVPAPVAALVLRALERTPSDRFPTAAAMADALSGAAPVASAAQVGELVSRLAADRIESIRAISLRASARHVPTPFSFEMMEPTAVDDAKTRMDAMVTRVDEPTPDETGPTTITTRGRLPSMPSIDTSFALPRLRMRRHVWIAAGVAAALGVAAIAMRESTPPPAAHVTSAPVRTSTPLPSPAPISAPAPSTASTPAPPPIVAADPPPAPRPRPRAAPRPAPPKVDVPKIRHANPYSQ